MTKEKGDEIEILIGLTLKNWRENKRRKFASNFHPTEKNNIHPNPNAVCIYFHREIK